LSSQSIWGSDRTLAQQAKPFLRWAGGKQRWLTANSYQLPSFNGQYYEPFLGGGSVFFHLVRNEVRPFQAWLGDNNLQLVRAYNEIRNDPEVVIDSINSLMAAYREAHDKRRFYEVIRSNFNDALPKSNTAFFIFLNATCWNGLWRTNQKGRFNVPFANPKSDDFMPSQEQIVAVSSALRNARIRASSWENLVNAAGSGDFVFLDPPYYSDSLQKGSPKYGSESFGYEEHARLARTLLSLQSRGVSFVLTNSNEPEMLALYRGLNLTVKEVMVPRAINSKVDERQAVGELIVSNSLQDYQDHASPGVLLDLEILRKTRQGNQDPR
jgi:DNA adenine methylase